MQEKLGSEWPVFLEALQQLPPVSVHLHPVKGVLPESAKEPVPWHPELGRYLAERPSFTLDPAFHAGAYYVQEASSMLVAEAFRQLELPEKGVSILDMSAAPGGKTTLLTSLIGPGNWILANEVVQSRFRTLRENVLKWGFANTAVTNLEPGQFSRLAGFFDLVLVDAPCSGEGLFRKDPKAMREWSDKGVNSCALRQKRILTEAVPLLRPGGYLLYSTCTYNDRENKLNAEWLTGEFGLQPKKLDLDPGWGIADAGPGYQCFPHKVRGEGFFLSVLQKEGSAITDHHSRRKKQPFFQALSKKERALVDPWLREPENIFLYTNPRGTISAFPKAHLADFEQLGQGLRKLQAGLPIGSLKGAHFIPGHALALSLLVQPALPGLDLNREQALRFLRKEDPFAGEKVPTSFKGWGLARYQDANLGWLKLVPGRVNNYLPKEWRIRLSP